MLHIIIIKLCIPKYKVGEMSKQSQTLMPRKHQQVFTGAIDYYKSKQIRQNFVKKNWY